jgi:TonB family protein
MVTTDNSTSEVGTVDALGALTLDVESRVPVRVSAGRARAVGLALAAALHFGIALVLVWSGWPDGFLDRDIEGEAIGVEIVSAQVLEPLDTDARARQGAAWETTVSTAAQAADTARTSATETPAMERAERELATEDQDAPLADRTDKGDAAPETAEAKETATAPPDKPAAAPSPNALALEAERAGAEAKEVTGAAAAALAVQTGGGRQAMEYTRRVVDTLRRQPPRPYSGSRRTVVILFRIGRDGAVATAEVRRTSGDIDVDREGLALVRQTRFPAPGAEVPETSLSFEIPVIFGNAG